MLVRDRMSNHPVTIRTDSDYKNALKLMQDHALHHVPVLDAGDKLVGIVAERDLLLAAMHYLQSEVEVGEVMHRNVVTAIPEMPITEAAMLMVNHKIGGLPVLDAGQRVVGVITETDIFRAFVDTIREGKPVVHKHQTWPHAGSSSNPGKRSAGMIINDPKYRPAPLLREMVDAGHLGCKTKRGFHAY